MAPRTPVFAGDRQKVTIFIWKRFGSVSLRSVRLDCRLLCLDRRQFPVSLAREVVPLLHRADFCLQFSRFSAFRFHFFTSPGNFSVFVYRPQHPWHFSVS